MANNSKKKSGPKKKARDEFNEDDVFQAPTILREPTSRQVKLGSKVVLRIQATGKPLPSYQWYHNGKKVVGAITDRLTLNKVRRLHAGAYHCEAKNFVGKTESRVCMLSFFTQKIPKLVIGPELSQIEEGKPFVLKVTAPAEAELKDLKIFWSFNGMRIKGAEGTELSINPIKKKYEGEYKAMISVGSGIETSNVAKLKVLTAKGKPSTSAAESPIQSPPTEAVPAQTESQASPQTEAMQPEIAQPEPTQPQLAQPEAKTNASWEDFLFNPDDEDETSDTEANLNNSESRDTPLSQLPTGELIREVIAEEGNSALLSSEDAVDLSSLLSPKETSPDDLQPLQEDPSSLIEALEMGASSPPLPGEPSAAPNSSRDAADPSSIIEEPDLETPTFTTVNGAENLIADWDGPAVQKIPKPKESLPAPAHPEPSLSLARKKLEKKKEFLERILSHWQQTGQRSPGKRTA